jgi:hypothetical protein
MIWFKYRPHEKTIPRYNILPSHRAVRLRVGHNTHKILSGDIVPVGSLEPDYTIISSMPMNTHEKTMPSQTAFPHTDQILTARKDTIDMSPDACTQLRTPCKILPQQVKSWITAESKE